MGVSFDLAWCYVPDMNDGIAFYRDVLGLGVQYESSHWTTLACGDSSLALHLYEQGGDPPSGGGWTLSLTTDDIRGLRSRLEGSSAVVGTKPHDTPRGAVLDVTDPFGNRLQVMQPGVFAADLA